ncbi:MAG TPA: AMP-binding protein [Sporichthyaceae bacterium]|nr:AMP-binding protein [Sporichthyaceae bacterium]
MPTRPVNFVALRHAGGCRAAGTMAATDEEVGDMARAIGAVEQLIRARVAEHPDGPWLYWAEETVSWAQTLSYAQRAANGLLEQGVRPGERVALLMANRPEFIWLHLGVLMIGGHSVPVNISQRGVTLEHILGDSDAVAVIHDDSVAEVVDAVAPRLPALRRVIPLDSRGQGPDVARLLSAPDVEPDVDLAEATGGVGMMYTSGTTGPPKGVVATGYDLAPINALLRSAGIAPGETMYTGLPLFHGNALLVSMLGSILLDTRLALAPKFTASGLWDHCRRYDAVAFNSLGGMISILLKQPPSARDRDHPVRTVLSAGCPPDRWEEFERRFGVRLIEWFGMVDAPGILLNTEGKVGSMGRSGVADVEFRVVDEDDNPLPAGAVGELVFRHPRGRLTHYHKLPEVTDEANRGGWFHTGDLADVDADGWFYYRGRKKESMRVLGENISAWEIETVLNGHPAILDSAAHAVASPLGEDEVKVCVIRRPGVGLEPAEVIAHCEGQMAKYAIPRYVEFVEELPKTATERNQYAALKARGITPQTWDRQSAEVAT